MAISKEILALVKLQMDKASADATSKAVDAVTKDVKELGSAITQEKKAVEALSTTATAVVKKRSSRKRGLSTGGSGSGSDWTNEGGTFGGRPVLALPPAKPLRVSPTYTKEQTESMAAIIHLGPAAASATETVAVAAQHVADTFDLSSKRFSTFSAEVISKAQVVQQIMEQLGMTIDEAIAASNNMTAGGTKVASNPEIDADVKRVLTMRQGLVDYANGVRPAISANNEMTDSLKEGEMSADEYRKSLEKTGTGLSETAQKWKAFSAAFAGFQLRFVGQSLTQFSTQLFTPIEKYISYMGIANKTSAEWADSQKDIEVSTARMGRSMAEILLPTMQSLSNLITELAEFFEQNPGLSKAVAGVGIGSAVLGNILKVVGTTLTAIAALKYVAPQIFGIMAAGKTAGAVSAVASAEMAAAGVGAGTAAAAGTSIASITTAVLPIAIPIIIAALATLAYKGIANTEFGKSRNMAAAPGQAWAIAAKGFGSLFGEAFGNKQFMRVAKLTGAIEGLGEEAEHAAGTLGPSAAAIDAYISYLQEVKDIEVQYEEDRVGVIEEYAKQRTELERQYAKDLAAIDKKIKSASGTSAESEMEYKKSITNTTRDYFSNEKQVLEDYYRERAKLARDYNIDVQRAEEDHQRSMRELQQDHEDRIMELANERDAFGIVAEEQQYEKQRSREEEEYAVEAARRSEDFALRLADMEAEFALERQRRAQEFANKIKEQQVQRQEERAAELADLREERKMLVEQHAEDLKQMQIDKDEELALLSKNKLKELQKLQSGFNDNLRLIDSALLGERKIRIAYYDAMSKDLQAWLSSFNGQFSSNLPNYPTNHAFGGYARGVVNTGEEGYEYILRNSTTRHLERAIGGKLTQENILNHARSGVGSATVQQNFRFDSSLSESERIWFKQVAHDEAMNGIMEVIG